jgi:hypothetical protein
MYIRYYSALELTPSAAYIAGRVAATRMSSLANRMAMQLYLRDESRAYGLSVSTRPVLVGVTYHSASRVD